VIYREASRAQAGVGSLLPLYAMLFFLTAHRRGFCLRVALRLSRLGAGISTGQRSPGMAADLAAEDKAPHR
jgi:hypothetical protein